MVLIDRRTLMGAAASALAATPLHAARRANPLLADIRHFVALGDHRAGSKADRQTADWLGGRLRRLGFGVSIDPFAIKTLVGAGAALTTGGHSIDAFPQWHASSAAYPQMITAPLTSDATPPMLAGSIVLHAAPGPLSAYWPGALDAAVNAAQRGGARALLIAVDDPTGAIFMYNRDADLPPLPLPVVVIGKRDLARVEQASATGQQATLRLAGKLGGATSHNLIARRPGVGPMLVVSTPLTGWFCCGAERGPGIALLLALAAVLARSPRPVLLVGTGAHEIGHLGMKRFLAAMPPPIDQVALWLHLGAGIGARALDRRFNVARPPQFVTLAGAVPAVAGQYFKAPNWMPLPANPAAPGEAGQVIAHGYPAMMGVTGVFPGFHTPQDDGSAVDAIALGAIAASLQETIAAFD